MPVLELADTADALRLFRAYDRIDDPAARNALVKIAETLAGYAGLPSK
jgi:hypothetical protein